MHPRHRHRPGPRWARLAAGLGLGLIHGLALANGLPPDVLSALQRAQLPASAVSVVVAPATPGSPPWVDHRSHEAVNPASAMKLVTTFAALDLLGPGHLWRTTVYTEGPIRDGVLQGSLYLRGGGDPKLLSETLWLLLHRVRSLGIQRIAGDIVLDRSAFDVPATDPGAFDGEPLRPYNASPDALLINFKAQIWRLVPDAAAGVARVGMEPPMAGVQAPSQVPLSAGPCQDWRASLRADFSDPLRPRFGGSFPASCGERLWPVAHPEPERMAERAVLGMWQALGGQLLGQVRSGHTPAQATERIVLESPPLAEVVRDVNKFSNNVMAQHLLLALAPDPAVPATFAAAQARVSQWWRTRIGTHVPEPLIDNGAGLSRDARITAGALTRLLQVAYASPMMAELMSSLPASGLDGTLRRSSMGSGLAHLKTGSLRDVQALAGYVHRPDGQRLVLVAVVNHPNARASRAALDALVQWAAQSNSSASAKALP
jgi:serine-type D-Ala-D-Ala carboxypeptidase/endopeptidase (penicillin-binding protein 4)